MTKTQHPKGVHFGNIKSSGRYCWVHVYLNGSYMGKIWRDKPDQDSWSADEMLKTKFGEFMCVGLPLNEAKHIVERVISPTLAESLNELNALVEHLESLRALRRELTAKAHRKDMKDE